MAKRGEYDQADAHYRDALREAELSKLPMLELLASRDWKRYSLVPSGRDVEEAEAVITSACAKMGKSRERMGVLLV